MTVKELIEKLNEYPEDMMVLVDGYEEGFDDLVVEKDHQVSLNKNSRGWDGKWFGDRNGEPVIVLSRK